MLYLSSGIPEKTISIRYPKTLHKQIKNSVFTALLKNHGSHPDLAYDIQSFDHKYHLYRNACQTHRNKSVNKIIYALEWQIVSDIIRSYKDQSKFHAAALEYKNNGYLFLGSSGSGKTSISIILMQVGWQLLSDEFGIFNLEDQRLHPFLRNFIIKPHHPIKQSIKDNYVDAIYRTDNKRVKIYYMPPSQFGSVAGNKNPKLKAIYYLESANADTFRLTRLKQYQALPRLLDKLYNQSSIKKNLSDFIDSIFRDIPHYELLLPNPFQLSQAEKHKLSLALTMMK